MPRIGEEKLHMTVLERIIELSVNAGASRATQWLRTFAETTATDDSETTLGDVLLGPWGETPAHLLDWPVSAARDQALDLVCAIATVASEMSRSTFDGPALWANFQNVANSINVKRYTSPAAYLYEHAYACTRTLGGLTYQFEPVPECWTDSGEKDPYWDPAREVPGHRNYVPYCSLAELLADGIAGVIVGAHQLDALRTAADLRGCGIVVMGPLTATPCRIVNWDGHGITMRYSVFETSSGGMSVVALLSH
jgi:hypothetical protein